MSTREPSPGAALAGRLVLLLSAVAALAAAGSALHAAATADAATVDAWWRGLTLPVFAGLFALLAAEPRRGPGLWGLVIANKVALAVTGLLLDADGAGDLVLWDGALSVLLVLALVLTRGWERPIR